MGEEGHILYTYKLYKVIEGSNMNEWNGMLRKVS